MSSVSTNARWLAALGLVTALFLGFNYPIVLGRATGYADADTQFFSYQVLVADYARAGRLHYWDPYTDGGLPVFGDPQVGLLSPLNRILGLLFGGSSSAFRLYWLLVWWLGGLGCLLLARHLGAPPWGGAAIALGFLFCGIYTGNAEHLSWLVGFSFLPLALWRLDVGLLSRRLWPAVEAGALWGLSALSGYPGLTILSGGFFVLWALGRALTHLPRRERPRLGNAAAAVTLLGLVGGVVLLPLYVGFLVEASGTHDRTRPLSRELALAGSLHPGALATLASPLPARLKFHHRDDLWPGTDLSMCSVYAGGTIAVLALAALLQRPRDPWRWWLALLAAGSLACALGQTLPLRGWLYDGFYPSRFFKHPTLFRAYALVALTALAALGARDLEAARQGTDERAWRSLPTASGLLAPVALATIAAFLVSPWSRGVSALVLAAGAMHAAGVWLGIPLASLAATPRIARHIPLPMRRWLPALLVTIAAGDAFLTSLLARPTILSRKVERWQALDRAHEAGLDLGSQGLRRQRDACYGAKYRYLTSDQLIAKVPVLLSNSTTKNAFHLTMADHPVLGRLALGTERIWFAQTVARAAPTVRVFDAFRARAEALGAAPLVLHSAGEMLRQGREAEPRIAAAAARIEALPAARRIPAKAVAYRPDELVLEVVAPGPGWLLVTDRWARSWRAEVDGAPATLFAANFVFRAVRVPAGPSRVRFAYRPRGFPWLVYASWGTLLAVALRSARLALAEHEQTATAVDCLGREPFARFRAAARRRSRMPR